MSDALGMNEDAGRKSAPRDLSGKIKTLKFMTRVEEAKKRSELERERIEMLQSSQWVLDASASKQSTIVEVSTQARVPGRMSFGNFSPNVEQFQREQRELEDSKASEKREKKLNVSETDMASRYSTYVKPGDKATSGGGGMADRFSRAKRSNAHKVKSAVDKNKTSKKKSKMR
eukprot:GFYU01011438.1.p1 GENE.GFYU01011438.1~~GFYU01011438.1.p1  ORF type:complete len:173 (-),score=38.01 GFYU01011438.1:66-584(-)